jgi:predicted transcriptional regulator
MKRITVSLPDELFKRVREAAGGRRQLSSYVAAALADYQERESLEKILAAWERETPVSSEVRESVAQELDALGFPPARERP